MASLESLKFFGEGEIPGLQKLTVLALVMQRLQLSALRLLFANFLMVLRGELFCSLVKAVCN